MKKYLITGLLIASGLALTGREQEDDNKMAQATSCMDNAQGSQAAECMAMVAGIDSPEASRIRCGAVYLIRGFGIETFKTAYQQIKSPPAGTDPTLALMAHVSFTTAVSVHTNRSGVQDADFLVNECQKAGSPGLVWLAVATKIGSEIVAAGATAGDPSTFAGNIGGVSDATVGTVALIAYEKQCKTGSAASAASCAEFVKAVEQAGGTSNTAAVGAALKALLASAAPGG